MIQAFGLTSTPRKDLPPAVDDVSFEARAGRVTVLLGAPGAGKTTALRLMLELQRGRGITHFRGRPLHRIAHPSREVGVLLGDVPGHPARTVRGHLRLLCAATGVPARRADEVLEVVGLVSLCEERLGTLSRGMDRRLGLACALLADPHTLVLDDPARGLSARESSWLYGTLRAHAAHGGTILLTTADPKAAARIADQVVTLEQGRLVADQDASEFARTRLRPRVAVRTPHAVRLAALLTKEARAARRSVEVVKEGGNRLSVYGSTCADVGETAFRHGILVHQLADEVGDMGPGAGTDTMHDPPSARESSPACEQPGRRHAGVALPGPMGPVGTRPGIGVHEASAEEPQASASEPRPSTVEGRSTVSPGNGATRTPEVVAPPYPPAAADDSIAGGGLRCSSESAHDPAAEQALSASSAALTEDVLSAEAHSAPADEPQTTPESHPPVTEPRVAAESEATNRHVPIEAAGVAPHAPAEADAAEPCVPTEVDDAAPPPPAAFFGAAPDRPHQADARDPEPPAPVRPADDTRTPAPPRRADPRYTLRGPHPASLRCAHCGRSLPSPASHLRPLRPQPPPPAAL